MERSFVFIGGGPMESTRHISRPKLGALGLLGVLGASVSCVEFRCFTDSPAKPPANPSPRPPPRGVREGGLTWRGISFSSAAGQWNRLVTFQDQNSVLSICSVSSVQAFHVSNSGVSQTRPPSPRPTPPPGPLPEASGRGGLRGGEFRFHRRRANGIDSSHCKTKTRCSRSARCPRCKRFMCRIPVFHRLARQAPGPLTPHPPAPCPHKEGRGANVSGSFVFIGGGPMESTRHISRPKLGALGLLGVLGASVSCVDFRCFTDSPAKPPVP